MSIEKYQQIMETTMTPVDYVIRLHEQLLLGLHQLEQLQQCTKEERFDTLQKLQQLFFELFATVDRTDPRGERLFVAYLYNHQRVVEMRLTDTYDELPDVEQDISLFLTAWKDYRHKIRRYRGNIGQL